MAYVFARSQSLSPAQSPAQIRSPHTPTHWKALQHRSYFKMLELYDHLAALDSTDACHSLQPLNVHGRQGQNPAS